MIYQHLLEIDVMAFLQLLRTQKNFPIIFHGLQNIKI